MPEREILWSRLVSAAIKYKHAPLDGLETEPWSSAVKGYVSAEKCGSLVGAASERPSWHPAVPASILHLESVTFHKGTADVPLPKIILWKSMALDKLLVTVCSLNNCLFL